MVLIVCLPYQKQINYTIMKTVMKYEQNPLNNTWLCWIPKTPQAYYVQTKKEAIKFCDNVNRGFESGSLYFDSEGKLCKKDN